MKTYPIAAVSRDTGVTKDTLRVWERRYGFPSPTRDAQGERCYSDEEVDALRVVKRLMDAGHRPGRLMGMTAQERLDLSHEGPGGQRDAEAMAVSTSVRSDDYLALVQALDAVGLRRRLTRDVAGRGLTRFLTELLAPLNVAVGEAWMRGELTIYEEHMFTSCVQSVLHQALAGLPDPSPLARPRVLLSTLPGEPHGIGLLMAELAFALDGANSLSLGVQTPLLDIGGAAAAFQADIVALSFSGCTNPQQMVDDLRELRARLSAGQALWVGGSAPTLRKRPVDGVHIIQGLQDLPQALLAWRQAQPA